MNKVQLLILLLMVSIVAKGQKMNKFKVQSDFRFRVELDRNARKTNGTLRENRDRLRYRLRLGFTYEVDNHFEFGARIRTGNPKNQQSPHITIGKEFHSDAFSLSKAYLKAKVNSNLWMWLGKNTMPMWRQNEMLWDDDVNPEGVTFGGDFNCSDLVSLRPILGYYITSHTNKVFSKDKYIVLAQLKYKHQFGMNNLSIASGYLKANELPNQPDDLGSYFIDYGIWTTSLQFKLKEIGLTLGFDFHENMMNYKHNIDMPKMFENQTTGYVASLKYKIKKIELKYFYAHIEKYAVIDFFAQDDWVRWGGANYTRSSNFAGHEFSLRYNVSDKFKATLRAFFVKGLVSSGINLETGTRIRIDLDVKI